MNVSVDQELCLGSGACTLKVPTVFHVNSDGLVSLPGSNAAGPYNVPAGDVDAVRTAAFACPATAILLDEVQR